MQEVEFLGILLPAFVYLIQVAVNGVLKTGNTKERSKSMRAQRFM